MSQIYGSLYEHLEPKRFTGGTPSPLLLEFGLAWEDMLEAGLKARIVTERPDEYITPEGIAFSPDLLIFEDTKTILGEIKLTFMSSREVPREVTNNFPDKFSKYFVQMMAYAHNLGLTHARLFVFFVCGNYERPFKPELLCWDLEFTKQELSENYEMLLNHARYVGLL